MTTTGRSREAIRRQADYHPWLHAAELDVEVVFADLGPETLGWWDPETRTVFLRRGLTQRQRRSVLAHECVHASHDDRPILNAVLNAKRERATDEVAARRLIPLERLIEALRWSGNERELADELWVDVHTVRVRFAALTRRERAAIEAATALG